MKSFTDIEQSKQLAKILPIDSADMWHHGFFNPSRGCKIEYNPPAPYHSVTHQWDCPCWSLAALFGVLPNENMLVKTTDGEYYCLAKDVMTKHYDNPVDACVAMIEKLHKLNLL